MQIVYVVGLGLLKVSILMSYLRYFPIGNLPIFIKIFITFVILMTVSCLLAVIFDCQPISTNFFRTNVDDNSHRCVNIAALQYSISSLIIATDVTTLLLPIREIWGMFEAFKWENKAPLLMIYTMSALSLLSRKRRAQLLFLFSLGGM